MEREKKGKRKERRKDGNQMLWHKAIGQPPRPLRPSVEVTEVLILYRLWVAIIWTVPKINHIKLHISSSISRVFSFLFVFVSLDCSCKSLSWFSRIPASQKFAENHIRFLFRKRIEEGLICKGGAFYIHGQLLSCSAWTPWLGLVFFVGNIYTLDWFWSILLSGICFFCCFLFWVLVILLFDSFFSWVGCLATQH